MRTVARRVSFTCIGWQDAPPPGGGKLARIFPNLRNCLLVPHLLNGARAKNRAKTGPNNHLSGQNRRTPLKKRHQHHHLMAKYKLEYLWLDGYEPVANIRGK